MKMQKVFNDIRIYNLEVNFLFHTRINCSFGSANPQKMCVVTCWKKKQNKTKKQKNEFLFVTE